MEVKNLKGVSPVIATILMVMITVGLVAFSYTWFMSLGQTSQVKVGQQMTQMEKSQQTFDILTAYKCANNNDNKEDDVCFQIRASPINTLTIPVSNMSVYINDIPRRLGEMDLSKIGGNNCTTVGNLTPGATCYGVVENYSCSIGDTIRIVIPWGAEKIRPITGCSS